MYYGINLTTRHLLEISGISTRRPFNPRVVTHEVSRSCKTHIRDEYM